MPPASRLLSWTPADEAELAVLTRALVDGYHEHRPSPGAWGEAVGAVEDWLHRRVLLSRAQALREAQADQEALVALLLGKEAA